MLRGFWRGQMEDDFETAWRQALLSGFVKGSALPAQSVRPVVTAAADGQGATATGLQVLIRPDPTIWDGSFANNAWLQELPKPLTRTVWENVIAISPRLAAQHKLKNGEVAVVNAAKRQISGPVWIQPGQQDDTITVRLGYGRRQAGSVGDGIGYDAYGLRRFDPLWHVDGATLRPAGTQRVCCDHAATGRSGRARLRAGAAGRRQAGGRQFGVYPAGAVPP